MKKLLLLFIVMGLASCKQDKLPVEEGQDSIAVDAAIVDTTTITESDTITDSANPIASIRAKVERINTIALQKKHFEFMCDEKMIVDYFYENGEIVKIAVDFGTVGDVYAKEGYYYDNGKLIFIYEFVEGGPACEGCSKTNEYRTYVANGKTIKYLKDKSAQPCKKCEFSKTSRQHKLLTATTADEMKAILCGL